MELTEEELSFVPSLASLGLADYSQVDMLCVRYNSVNVGVEQSPEKIEASRIQRIFRR